MHPKAKNKRYGELATDLYEEIGSTLDRFAVCFVLPCYSVCGGATEDDHELVFPISQWYYSTVPKSQVLCELITFINANENIKRGQP